MSHFPINNPSKTSQHTSHPKPTCKALPIGPFPPFWPHLYCFPLSYSVPATSMSWHTHSFHSPLPSLVYAFCPDPLSSGTFCLACFLLKGHLFRKAFTPYMPLCWQNNFLICLSLENKLEIRSVVYFIFLFTSCFQNSTCYWARVQ